MWFVPFRRRRCAPEKQVRGAPRRPRRPHRCPRQASGDGMAKAPLSRVIRAAAHDPPCQGKEKNCTFGRCRGGLHADSCQRDAAPVVRKVGVVPGAISARGQPPRCNIQSARPQIHSRAGRLFFLTFSRHGVLLKERTAPMRGRRDLLGAPPDRWHAIDAPRLRTRPVYPTRAPPTPSTRYLLPPVAKEQD